MKKIIWIIEISCKAYDWTLHREYYTDWEPAVQRPIMSRALARKSLADLRADFDTTYRGYRYRIGKYERVTGA